MIRRRLTVIALGLLPMLFSQSVSALPETSPAQDASTAPLDATPIDGSLLDDLDQETGAIPCMHSMADDAACEGIGSAGESRLSMKLDRGVNVSSGILDKVDGVRVDYRLASALQLNVLAGYQGIGDNARLDSAKRLVGLSADFARAATAWDMNTFYLEQQDKEGIISRALGGALRYLKPRRSVLVYVDYDASSEALGMVTATGAWQLLDRTTLSTTLDLRDSPFLKRQQRYLSRSMAITEGWNGTLPVDRIDALAGKSGQAVATFALGISHRFADSLSLSGSAAVLDLAYAKPGADETAARRSSEYFYNLSLAGNHPRLRTNGKLDLHHRVSAYSRRSTASLDALYALSNSWNLKPRVKTDYRSNLQQDSIRWTTSPTVKLEYRNRGNYALQFEAGGEWSRESAALQDRTRSSYFLSVGYQARF